jgi:hypothetical protein
MQQEWRANLNRSIADQQHRQPLVAAVLRQVAGIYSDPQKARQAHSLANSQANSQASSAVPNSAAPNSNPNSRPNNHNNDHNNKQTNDHNSYHNSYHKSLAKTVLVNVVSYSALDTRSKYKQHLHNWFCYLTHFGFKAVVYKVESDPEAVKG